MSLVCPPNLEMGVFTAEALDNNGSSTTTVSFLTMASHCPALCV